MQTLCGTGCKQSCYQTLVGHASHSGCGVSMERWRGTAVVVSIGCCGGVGPSVEELSLQDLVPQEESRDRAFPPLARPLVLVAEASDP